jgi:hypothetical protein
MKIFAYDSLGDSDLTVDAIYEGGSHGNVSDDPICSLLSGCGSLGGL